MIEGVSTKKLKVMPDERGRLMEILRVDDALFEKFGQVYMTTTHPGVIKAWHYHKLQDDNVCVVRGMLKLALFDDRQGSPTRGEVNEFFLGEHNPLLVHIPKNVYHGWKCVSAAEALVINVSSELYRHQAPDEVRLPPHDNQIPYDWSRHDG